MFSLVRAPLMSDPEINDSDATSIFAENTYFPDDQTLPIPMFTIVFNVVRKFCPSTAISARNSIFIDHNRTHNFEHPLHRFSSPSESKSVITDMLSTIEIPFPLNNNLYWKNRRCNRDVTPMNGVDDMVARVSEFAEVMIRSAGDTGCKRLHMLVTIEKRMVVPERDYELMVRSREEEAALESYRYMMSRIQASRDRNIMRLLERRWPALMREIGRMNSRAEEAAAADEVEFGSAPAAKSAVEALERLRYEGGTSDYQSILMCPVCMEEVMIGSRITRMPCSHMFHGDCILKWLEKSHTCPICRFNLPSDHY